MSAKSRLSSSALYALCAGMSRMQVIRAMSEARAAKAFKRSPALFVTLARHYHHDYLRELAWARDAQANEARLAELRARLCPPPDLKLAVLPVGPLEETVQ